MTLSPSLKEEVMSSAAEGALRLELERLRPGRQMALTELVEQYLRVHQAAPATTEKLR